MPRLVRARPAYSRHRPSGQAIAEFGGKRHYLGIYGSPESYDRYTALVDAWIAAERPRVFEPPKPPETTQSAEESEPVAVVDTEPLSSASESPPVLCGELTIVELAAAFWDHAQVRYVKYGRQTGTHDNYRPVLRLLRERYGEMAAGQFGPKALKRLQAEMIQRGNSRRYVNDNIDRIRKVFAWGVSDEIVPTQVLAALETVESIPTGAAGVVEHEPIEPVSDEVVLATLPHLPPLVADMVRIQLLLGCRPGELCLMRPQDIDRSEAIWTYRPQHHKTEHHGIERHILIGPQAQKILEPYLHGAQDKPCFSPAASERQRAALRARRPRVKGERRPGEAYTKDSYRRAIERACEIAFVMPKELRRIARKLSQKERQRLREAASQWRRKHCWAPNQLRHSAATKICNQYESLMAAQEVLGHSSIKTTKTYAKPSLALAKRVMAEMG